MSEEDREYYRERMRQELAQAVTCEDNGAAKSHLDLAELHRQRAEEASKLTKSRQPG